MERLQKKQKVNKFPQSALAFYIKLYCKRKGSSKTKYPSKLVEATKSWLSLEELEKQQFVTKYKDYEHKFQLQCYNQLKNAEPFMKIKNVRSNNQDLNTNNVVIHELAAHIEEVRPQIQAEQAEQSQYNEEITLSSEVELPIDKTGKDLFHMLNPTDKSNNVTWTSLAHLERNQYSRAVFLLKKDYITKYKEYLENLSTRELFDYYNKTLF